MIENPVPWPNGARCAVAMTWDVDVDSGVNVYNPDRGDTLVCSQSQTRYDVHVAVPRIVKELKKLDMRQTFFIPGWCIEKYPASIDLLLAAGHEVALHGYLHERPNEQSAEDELYWLERCLDQYRKRVGGGAPGWRAPSFAFSKHSLGYLVQHKFSYDSSLMGDDVPYMLRHANGTLLELPTDMTLDDWPHYMHNRDFRFTMPISAPSRAIEVMRAEFDAAWKHGGMWISVWHPYVSGRMSRFEAALELLDYMQQKGKVWFATTAEIAQHVKGLIASKKWTPREEKLPAYESPLPELSKKSA
ncbi:MAG: polysaccharide deacetylase family protein [Hyphomicrobium sp.]|uniref:polysaccharide deacetylase family protein n=1 Tax=Hyphomicrobium sp. TaxID=82 RepID=UPI003D119480